MATSGRRAQEAIRAHGSKKCSKHYGKDVIYVCEDCDVLACVDCATQQHKRHALEGIGNVVPQAKQKLQDFLTRIEQTELPRIKGKFQKVNEDLSKNKEQFKQRVSQIKKRNEILKKELDKIADTLVKTCHDMENQNSDILLNHQKELQTQIDELSSKIQEVKASLQSGNDVLVLDTSYMVSLEVRDLPIPSCNIAAFTPGTLQKLEHLFGELNFTGNSQPSMSLSVCTNLGVTSEITPYEEHNAKSIHSFDDQTWLSFYKYGASNDSIILSVNRTGQVTRILDMDVRVSDFCISPQTRNIWFCSCEDKSVREVNGGSTKIKFTTDKYPYCICVTRDDHVLVGVARKIMKHTRTGRELCSTLGGKSLVVRKPYHIKECPLTRNIAVTDRDLSTCAGNDKPFVSILSDQLQILYIYRGEVSPGQQPFPGPFSPYDAFFTNAGELVITDYDNKSLVLVSGTGKYLQTLYTFSKSLPVAVCVNNGEIWVSLSHGKVNVLKIT